MATKIVTGKVRFSFVNIWEPRAQNGGVPKYSITLLIPKSDRDTYTRIQTAMQEAAELFRQKKGSSALPAKPNTTLHDGDGVRDNGDPFGPECRGCWVITVSSKNQPIIVDRNRQPILDTSEVYSGCYGRVSMNFYGYNNSSGKKGISAELLSVQKLADGQPFGIVGSADDFDDGYKDADDDGWM